MCVLFSKTQNRQTHEHMVCSVMAKRNAAKWANSSSQSNKIWKFKGDESFQASKGFVTHFKKRHGIAQISISRESRSADELAINMFPAELKSILQNEVYHEEQLYNCDETALFAKLLPDKTLAFNYETQKTDGFKKIKIV
ncbi:unnamed protein product [Caretta caretta]